jgi:hypothetical protein
LLLGCFLNGTPCAFTLLSEKLKLPEFSSRNKSHATWSRKNRGWTNAPSWPVVLSAPACGGGGGFVPPRGKTSRCSHCSVGSQHPSRSVAHMGSSGSVRLPQSWRANDYRNLGDCAQAVRVKCEILKLLLNYDTFEGAGCSCDLDQDV